MENNRSGIFYGVIGVATLIVAIIGATFAYFSATASSDANAVRTDAAQLALSLMDYRGGLKGSLIPVEADGSSGVEGANANFKYYPGTAATDCIDDAKNNICSVYTFTIVNDSESAIQTVYGYFIPTEYTMTNLHFAAFRGNNNQIATATNEYTVTGDVPTTKQGTYERIGNAGDLLYASQKILQIGATVAGTYDQKFTIGETQYDAYPIPGWTQKLAPNNPDAAVHVCVNAEGTAHASNPASEELCEANEGYKWLAEDSYATFTVLLWLQEIGTDQTAVDSLIEGGAYFAGAVGFTTSGGGSGVTGAITATNRAGRNTSA